MKDVIEAPTTNYPQILDGFCYSGLFGNRPLNHLSWYWRCLEKMEDLRLAADSYRPRWYTVPKNFIDLSKNGGGNIRPGETVFYEFQVKEGSWLWGLQFAVLSNDAAQSSYSIVIRQGSELPLTDRPMVASAVFSGNPIDPLNTLNPAVDLLSSPRLIQAPTQLHVEISNDQEPTSEENTISAQLLLLFAEPK
jgi:hypothetical protein